MHKSHDVNSEVTGPGAVVPEMTPLWVDHGVTPAYVIAPSPELAAQYLANALMHPIYERWNWQRLIKVYGALPDARRAKPRVCKLLLITEAVVEYWQKGKLHVVAPPDAPDPAAIVLAVLKSHKTRFRLVTPGIPSTTTQTSVEGKPLPFTVALRSWLQRTGRLYNPHEHTNTLGSNDDYEAVSAFLRERTSRSIHTWRAYTKELERLVTWCQEQDLGPLSDLTRQELLRYQSHLQKVQPGTKPIEGQEPVPTRSLVEKSQARSIAVVASLYRYWHSTGYLQGNPAAGLTGGSRAQAGFAPTRLVSAEHLALCDAFVERSMRASQPLQAADVNVWRSAAIWHLFRFSGGATGRAC